MTTKQKTDCRAKGLCHYESATRTNFFNGMLLTDDALRAEQLYHRNALERLNRYMWGSGIVCGFEVESPANGLCITVKPGFALDCHGNAIESCKCVTIDLADQCKSPTGEPCAPPPDGVIKRCLVVRYAEIEADPQPVLTSDDECGGSSDRPKCLASKYREGLCFELRENCEPVKPCADEQGDVDGLLTLLWQLSSTARGQAREELNKNRPSTVSGPKCPACDCGCSCDECSVCLATLEIDCKGNTVTVEGLDCRRYVWGPQLFRFLVCGLFARMEKQGAARRTEGVPSADTISANPMQALWDVGTLAAGTMGNIREYVEDLHKRVVRLESAQGGKAKP